MKSNEQKRNEIVSSYFAEPYQTSNEFKETIEEIIEPAFKLLPKNRNEDRAFLGYNPKLTIDFEKVYEAKVPENGITRKNVLNKVTELFEGAVNWGSSLALCNVNPESNRAGLQAFLFCSLFSPNILEGEYAWNVHKAELECGAMLGDLAWDEGKKAGCIFTYGGQGGWQYALQYGKTRVLKDSMSKGIYEPCKVICSTVAQFSKQHCVVWGGIGTDNLIQIPVDDNNRMKIDELEKVLIELHEKDIPIAMVVGNSGTTDTNSFDDLEAISKLMEKYPNNPKKYGKAILYADAVIGFSWLSFKGYDFKNNPLGFNKEALPIIEEMYEHAKKIKFADCYSTDFHKSGYCPYVATSFNYRDRDEFVNLMSYIKTSKNNHDNSLKYAYLQERSPYNPMYYSLESSRSGAGSCAAWATLHYFGLTGFRLVNGWEVEHHIWLRKFIEQSKNIITVNPNNHGQVTLFRIYDELVTDAKAEYEKELNDPSYKEKLIANNKIIEAVGNKLYSWVRTGKRINGKFTPYISFSTGFRATNYNEDFKDPEAVVYALKVYAMQFHSTVETFDWVIKCVKLALNEVINEIKTTK